MIAFATDGPTKKGTLRQKSAITPPCYFQLYPRNKPLYDYPGRLDRTPTTSIESRSNWAARQSAILLINHKYAEPTHEATIKFLEPQTLDEIKRTTTSVARKIKYYTKTRHVEIAGFWVREIDRSNKVHIHILLRTNDPFIRSTLEKCWSKASNGKAELCHIEEIKSADAFSKYMVKDLLSVKKGEKEVLLFRKHLRFNLCGQFGGYFVESKQCLWRQWIKEHHSKLRDKSFTYSFEMATISDESNGFHVIRSRRPVTLGNHFNAKTSKQIERQGHKEAPYRIKQRTGGNARFGRPRIETMSRVQKVFQGACQEVLPRLRL